MYCTRCGHQMKEEDVFCSQCGQSARPGYSAPARGTLSRPVRDKRIGGVCAGFARYFDVDVTLMRILWLVGLILTGGLLLLVYIAAWILMPRDEGPPAANIEPRPEESGPVRA